MLCLVEYVKGNLTPKPLPGTVRETLNSYGSYYKVGLAYLISPIRNPVPNV